MALGFYLDAAKCTGCKTCMVACKDKNNLPVGMNFRRVTEYSGGRWEQNPVDGSWRQDAFGYYLSVACNHCENPVCVQACPTGAHHRREDGLVAIDRQRCVGCGMCAVACPYGAPQFDGKARKMRKCDACSDLLAKGRNPACVDACPQRALEFGDIGELKERHAGAVGELAPLPPASVTRPNLIIRAPSGAKPVGDASGTVYFPLKR